MIENTSGILVIFRKENDGYKYDSLGGYEHDYITAGKLRGLKLSSFDEILCGHMFLEGSEVLRGTSTKDSYYAYGKIPEKVIDTIFSLTQDSDLRVKYLQQLYKGIELIKTSPVRFKVVNNYKSPKFSANEKKGSESVAPHGSNYINRNKINQESKPTEQLETKGSTTKTNSSGILDINVNQIIGEIKEKIVGQDEAVESVVSNIYANQRIIETGNKDLIATQKASILLDGPTGTGKTAILKEVADKLSLPIVITSSTTYSSTGYVGSSLTDILVKLIEKANGNLELAQKGIVCIDEIDKFGGFSKDNELVMKRAVQQDLLTFISGGKFNVQFGGKNYEFDTSNLTFIGMGAFTSLRDKKINEKSTKKTTIGFVSDNLEEQKEEDKTYTINVQDYIDYGLERELIGRFALLTSTRAYSVEDYKNILLKSTISPLKTFVEFAKNFGIEEVIYDDEFIQEASEMAYKANFGARGLHQIISNLKNLLLIDIINNRSKSITLTTEMLKKSEEKSKRTY